MTSRTKLGIVTVALLLLTAPAAKAAGHLTVSVDRTTIETRLGRTFVIRTRIANHGGASAAGLIAHLNILSLRGDVYVDPEDWSTHRTRYLSPIPARGATTLAWKLNAVNAGHLGVYVAVLPRNDAGIPPITGPTVDVTIADRRTLNSGGILPLVLGIPALFGLLTLSLRVGRGGSRRAATPS